MQCLLSGDMELFVKLYHKYIIELRKIHIFGLLEGESSLGYLSALNSKLTLPNLTELNLSNPNLTYLALKP